MVRERRQHIRRDVNYPCWLSEGKMPELIEARISNISDGGAKVICEAPEKAKKEHIVDLYLTRDRKVGRRCKVVWRSSDAIGLVFLAKMLPPREADDHGESESLVAI
jgi:hypothetical protein